MGMARTSVSDVRLPANLCGSAPISLGLGVADREQALVQSFYPAVLLRLHWCILSLAAP